MGNQFLLMKRMYKPTTTMGIVAIVFTMVQQRDLSLDSMSSKIQTKLIEFFVLLAASIMYPASLP